MPRYQVVFGCRNPAKWGRVVDVELDINCRNVPPAEAQAWLQGTAEPDALKAMPKGLRDKWLGKLTDVKVGKKQSPAHAAKDAEWEAKIANGFHTRWGRKTFSTLGVIVVDATPAQAVSILDQIVVQAAAPDVPEITRPAFRVRQSIFSQAQIDLLADPTVVIDPFDFSHLTFAQVFEAVP